MAKIAVVGAGLVGRLLALLLDKQHSVSLFDKSGLYETDSTGCIAAAMIAPTAESVIASESIVTMGKASLQLWPKLLASLNLNVPFQQSGSLVLAHHQDEADLLSFFSRLKGCETDAVKLEPNALHGLEPDIEQHFKQILYLPNEGQVDNLILYQQTQQAILNAEIQLFLQREVQIKKSKSLSAITIVDGEESQCFDWVFDCRGLGAKKELLAKKKTLRGVRGEVIRVRAPDVKITRPVRLMHPRYPLYIVPKSDHHYVIGATEIESEDDKPTSVRSALELLSAAYSVHKGFAEATLESIQSGLRPTLDDNEPIISRDGRHIQINGLYRHGYLLAPYLLHHTLNYFKGIADDTATTKSYSDMDLLSNVSLFTSADLKRAKTFN